MNLAIRLAEAALAPVAASLDRTHNDVEAGTVERAIKIKHTLAKIQNGTEDSLHEASQADSADAVMALRLAQDLLKDVCAVAKNNAPGFLARWFWTTIGAIMRRYSIEEDPS